MSTTNGNNASYRGLSRVRRPADEKRCPRLSRESAGSGLPSIRYLTGRYRTHRHNPTHTPLSLESRILELADRCVKCGLCLPHCPTYRLRHKESESPRGRIAILQGLAGGQLEPAGGALDHLASCLDCRNCETVCPAGVEYETLLDTGQQWLRQHAPRRGPRRYLGRLGLAALIRPARLARIHALLRLYQRTGLQWLLRRSGLLRLAGVERADRLLPPLQPAARFRLPPPPDPPVGRVALFTGCLGTTLEQATLAASITLLHRLGYAISLPGGQGCCGALSWHAGEAEPALRAARRNLDAFRPDEVDAILHTATGCGAHLRNYPQLPWTNPEDQARARQLADKSMEITAFLARQSWPEDRIRKSAPLRVAVHIPCSQRNGLRQPDYATDLLKRIPGLEVVPLPGQSGCCGAGGTAMLGQPELADALRAETLREIKPIRPDVIVSTNPGCALFLNAGLEQEPPLRVVHPVVLLAGQAIPA